MTTRVWVDDLRPGDFLVRKFGMSVPNDQTSPCWILIIGVDDHCTVALTDKGIRRVLRTQAKIDLAQFWELAWVTRVATHR